MDCETVLSKKARKPRGKGPADPVFNARMPASLIEAIKAKARTRNVAYSIVVREALSRFVEKSSGEHAA